MCSSMSLDAIDADDFESSRLLSPPKSRLRNLLSLEFARSPAILIRGFDLDPSALPSPLSQSYVVPP